MEILAAIILGAIVVCALLIYTSLSWGYVISLFYGWFILPIFPNLPKLGIIQFIAISLFIKALLPLTPAAIKDEYKDKNMVWVSFFLSPWLTLFFGWIIKMFFI